MTLRKSFALLLLALGLSGCYFKGREGYICESSKDCDPGLVCRTFSYRNDSRNACVPRGTSSIGSKSTYTEFGVYAAWVVTLLLPLGVAALVIKERVDKKRAGS
jgi:hypothetical protein